MNMMKKKVLQAGNPVLGIEDHFRSYFVMNEYQLRNMEGNLKTILSAQLSLILQSQGCVCTQYYDPAFGKLVKAIKYERPEEMQWDESPQIEEISEKEE